MTKTSKIYYTENIITDVSELGLGLLKSIYTVPDSMQLIFVNLGDTQTFSGKFDKSQFIKVESGNGEVEIKYGSSKSSSNSSKSSKSSISKGSSLIIPSNIEFKITAINFLEMYILYSKPQFKPDSIILLNKGTMSGPKITGIKCQNNVEAVLQEDPNDLDDVIYIKWGNQKDFTCYDKESLLQFVKEEDSVMADWVQNPEANPMDSSGRGGIPGKKLFYKLYGDTPIWITSDSYLKLLIGIDKFIGKPIEKVRLGNTQGIILESSRLHGQLPGELIYELEPLDSGLSPVIKLIEKYNSIKDFHNWYLKNVDDATTVTELMENTVLEIELREQIDTKIPESIGALTHLTNLVIENSLFDSLPDTIGNLTNLTSIQISNTDIANLPESFSNLKNLERIKFTQNNFTEIPEYFKTFTNLKYLVLSANKITTVPEFIVDLPNLETFKIGYNDFDVNSDSLPKKVQDFIQTKSLEETPEENTPEENLGENITDDSDEDQEEITDVRVIDLIVKLNNNRTLYIDFSRSHPEWRYGRLVQRSPFTSTVTGRRIDEITMQNGKYYWLNTGNPPAKELSLQELSQFLEDAIENYATTITTERVEIEEDLPEPEGTSPSINNIISVIINAIDDREILYIDFTRKNPNWENGRLVQRRSSLISSANRIDEIFIHNGKYNWLKKGIPPAIELSLDELKQFLTDSIVSNLATSIGIDDDLTAFYHNPPVRRRLDFGNDE